LGTQETSYYMWGRRPAMAKGEGFDVAFTKLLWSLVGNATGSLDIAQATLNSERVHGWRNKQLSR